MRSRANRVSLVFVSLTVLGVTACSENPSVTQPVPEVAVMALTPPPPPLDGDDFFGSDDGFFQANCASLEELPPDEFPPGQVDRQVPLTADPRLLIAKAGAFAMLQLNQPAFRIDGPNATVPAGTFVQQRDGRLSGRGVIVLAASEPAFIFAPLRADMALAVGDLMIEGIDADTNQPYRRFEVRVPVTRLDGTPDIEVCGTSGWSIRTTEAVLSLRY